MEISTTELLHYIRCPFYYNFRWNQNTPVFKIKAHEHWKNCLYSSSINFFKQWISNSEMPTLESLQDSWNADWYPPPEEDVALDFTGSQRKTKQTLGNEGWINLLHMYRYFENNPLDMEAVDYPFNLSFGENTLTGKIDILTKTDPSLTNIMGIKICPSTYEATKMYGYNSLEMVAYRMAIKQAISAWHSSGDIKKQNIKAELGFFVLENVNKPFYTTHRTDDQEEVLSQVVTSICNSINNNNYYPDFGYKCHNCDFKSKCNKGKWIEAD